MANSPGPGTVIAHLECGGCGKSVGVKLNKNLIGYYYCPHTTDTGQPCAHHERWGREDSAAMTREYLEAQGKSDGTATRKENDTGNRPGGTEPPGNWLVG